MTRKLNNAIFSLLLLLMFTACQYQQPDYLTLIKPAELHQLMQNQDIFLIDVHTPQQNHIKGTDLFIPFNEIAKHQGQLPQDKSAPIYLYCQGGPMGNAASKALHELGYQHLFNLEGGAAAWKNAGFEFE